jgi:hypothetical protein
MRRSTLFAITTTLLFALAVGAVAAALFMPPAPVSSLPAMRTEETVRQFYAAANDVIATGDPAPLRAVVAEHFVDVDPLPGVAPGRAGLEAYLMTLHGVDPGMRLEVKELVAAGDRVVARVDVRNSLESESTPLDGSVIDQSPPWGAVESFRIAAGSIVERRSDTDELAVIRDVASASLSFAAPTPRAVSVERITFAPGARWDAPRAGPRLLVLESGALQLEFAADAGIGQRQTTPLAAGGAFAVPAAGRVAMTNPGTAVARLLAVTFAVPVVPGPHLPPVLPRPSGVSVQTLAGGLATNIGVGSGTVVLGRATLARDARLALTSTSGLVLLAVDAGEVDMAAWGTSWVRRGPDGTSTLSTLSTGAALAAGDGLLLEPNGLAALRGAGAETAEALIVTVRQDPPAPSGSPTP